MADTANIDMFSAKPPATLDDFANTAPAPNTTNDVTNAARAAYASTLSPDPAAVVQNYQAIRSDLTTSASSYTEDKLVNDAREKDFGSSRQALLDVLSNPSIPADQKAKIAQGYTNALADPTGIRARDTVSANALIAPSDGENKEQENVRLDAANFYQQMNDNKKAIQGQVVAAEAMGSQSLRDTRMEVLASMVPFYRNLKMAGILSDYHKAAGDDTSQAAIYAKAILMPGSTREEMAKQLASAPLDKQVQIASTLIDAIKSSKSITGADNVDSAALEELRAFTQEGAYMSGDKYADNVFGALDLLGLGAVPKALGSVTRGFKEIPTSTAFGIDKLAERASQAARQDAVRTEIQPMSVGENFAQVNPGKAKSSHDAAMADDTGQTAEALYGTTRDEAAAGNMSPEIAKDDGSVANRVHNIDSTFNDKATPAPNILELVQNNDGGIYYTEGDKRMLRAQETYDFQNATGLRTRDEMTTITPNETGVNIDAVYGPTQNGFSNAQDALDLVKWTFRDKGLTDENVSLIRRVGDKYVPVDAADEAGLAGDYLVRVKHKYDFDPHDSINLTELGVKKNFFDRIPGQYNFQRYALDPHSMLDPHITLGANAMVDASSALRNNLLKLSKNFTDLFVKLPKDEQGNLWDWLLKANEAGTNFGPNQLAARNFSPAAEAARLEFRKYWDTHFWLENRDLAKSMHWEGYQVLEDGSNQTRLFVRGISKSDAHSAGEVYDVAKGQLVRLDSKAVEDLYSRDGQIAKLRTPVDIHGNGNYVEHVINPNSPGGVYTRAIAPHDQVLNYRPNYHQVRYKDDKFVIERVKDAQGKLITERAIATANNKLDASLSGRRIATVKGKRFGDQSDEHADYYVRGDVKQDRSLRSRDEFDLHSSAGRVAQKIRGNRLADASSPVNNGAQFNHVLGPVDSMIHAARSIAARTSLRDYLEAAKQRAIQQYGQFFPKENGIPKWPTGREFITKRGNQLDKDVADARTTWQYINSLEDASWNAVDDATKYVFSTVADMFGSGAVKAGDNIVGKTLSLAERGAKGLANNVAPTHILKSAGNFAFIATSPIRQLILQPHQAMMLVANFPGYTASGMLVRDLSAFLTMQGVPKAAGNGFMRRLNKVWEDTAVGASKLVTQRSEAEIKLMMKQFEDSGLASSIDSHALLKGSLSDMAELSRYSGKNPLFSPLSSATNALRKVGFDAGEYINILSAWLAHRDEAVQAGLTLDKSVLNTIAAKARNYTGNMNLAGEMPMSQGTAGVFFQYMQAPFKAGLAMSNRALPVADRARMATLYAMLFAPIPAAVVSWVNDVVWDSPEQHKAMEQNAESYLFNTFMSKVSGKDIHVDLSSLNPVQMYGTYDVIKNLATMDLGKAIANTPSGQLFIGSNPRITDSLRTAARYMHLTDDHANPTQLVDAIHGFVGISSGGRSLWEASQQFKALYAGEVARKLNSTGAISLQDVNGVQVAMQAAGFPDLETSLNAEVKQDLYLKSEAFKQDVTGWYNQYKRDMAMKGDTSTDPGFVRDAYTEFFRVGNKGGAEARQIINTLMIKDLSGTDTSMQKLIMRAAMIPENSDIRAAFEKIPDPEQRAAALKKLNEWDKLGAQQ